MKQLWGAGRESLTTGTRVLPSGFPLVLGSSPGARGGTYAHGQLLAQG